MRKPRLLLAIFALPFALLVIASSAGAGPPATATGTWDCRTSVFTLLSLRTAGDNTILSFSAAPCVNAGDVTGTFTTFGTEIRKSDGSRTFHGGIVCTGCTFAGRTGDFTAAQTFQGPSDTEYQGIVTVLSATGGLAGLHAVDHFEATGQAHGTYSWNYSFEP